MAKQTDNADATATLPKRFPLKPAFESFREGWRDAQRGETILLSELWEGIEEGEEA